MSSDFPQTLSPALPAGQLLEEYSLLSVLGMGSFGITYLAADSNLHLKVAIKEYFPSNAAVRNHFSSSVALKSDQAKEEYLWGKERFVREAQTLARFRHKNIVQVFRYFEGNGTCYMVMAYEEGMSLEQVLDDGETQWDQQATLALVMPLLDGLEKVHQAGFLHRDIKPANIVLRANGDGPVLIDFGAARSPAATDAMTVVLSHGYGPPEQYSRQGNQGSWTDIYAMAGVLYRIVTGIVPPPSLHRVKNDAMIPAAFMGEGRFSPDFLGAIDLGLNVDETRRPQTVGEWRQLLGRGASDGAIVVAPARPAETRVASNPHAAGHQANAAGGKAASSTADSSPGFARGRTDPSRTQPRSRRMEEEAEPGFLGRLGQTMIAHPFLTLLLLFGSLFMAMFLSRRSGPHEYPAQPAAPVTSTAPTRGIPLADPVLSPQDRPRPVPNDPPSVPTQGQNPPGKDPGPEENPNDGERRRNLLAEAVNACAGKAMGASCIFIDRRNESLNGTCVALPSESLACRPDRFGERGDRTPGSLPYRPNAGPQPMDNRAPRYR